MAEDPQVRKIRDRWTEGSKDISDLQAHTWETRAFLAGQQWMTWDRTLGRLKVAERNPDRVRATINRIGPDSRRIIAKLTASPLQFNVIPATPDDAARRGAALAESILGDAHRELSWEDIRIEHAWACWEGGTALIAVDWDRRAGKKLDDNTSTGDVALSVVSMTEVATIPGTRDIRTAPWWIRATAVPPAEAAETYGLSELPAADAQASSTYATRAINAGRSRDTTADLTLVLTYYERPCDDEPDGKMVTVIGDQVVESVKWPFPFTDRLNLAVARVVQVPGRWAGHAVAWDAIGVQTLYNSAWSSIIEHMKLAGNARFTYTSGQIDNPEQLTDTAGEFLELNPIANAPQPGWTSPPQLPTWVLDGPDKLRQELDDILGVHEVSRGVAPKNIESGVGLSILDENDQTPIGSYARELAKCWGDVARMTLRLYQDKVTETRTAKVEIPGMPPELCKWTGKSIQGQTQAVVPVDAFTPMTRAAKLNFAFQMHDRFRDMEGFDLATVVKLADLDQGIDMTATVDPDLARAQRENHFLAQGQARTVMDIDNDEIHLQAHLEFMLSERYEYLDDDTKELFVLHRQAHLTQMAEKTGKAEAAMRVSPTFGQVPSGVPQPLGPDQILPGGPEPGVDVTPDMLIPPEADMALPPQEPPLV